MNKNTGIIIGIIILVVVVSGIYTFRNKEGEKIIEKENTEQQIKSEEKVIKDAVIEKNETIKTGSYEAYSADKIARAETGDVVLFFHASWCPSCRGLNTNIERNLKSIPEEVSILKTDYDQETALKKKYGVTYQHTLVQVDKNGNMIQKWSGSPSLENLLSQIQ